MDNYDYNNYAPQGNMVGDMNTMGGGVAQDGNMFDDPNSFVPQNLRQYNTLGRYFSTRGRDVYGQETKFFFTQEERNYLTQNGVSAQEFYDRFQSKLGGDFVQGMPKSRGFTGPNYSDPNSFIPGDMRANCYDRGYTQFWMRDEYGFQKAAYLTNEEINFTRVANMDIGTYVNTYQKEFDYDRGQMERQSGASMDAMQDAGNVQNSAR